MNFFLEPSGEFFREAPRRAYARSDEAAPIKALIGEERIVIFSAISAERFGEHPDDRINLQQLEVFAVYSIGYQTALFRACSEGLGLA
ncbi:hypothetical protein [Lentisalinibacter salinarum]|uniref:hypothetical protein n=1 Tax=Lentisalinibacter salinarum TaxID=2992239 RepID=UPI0038672AC5